MLSTTVQLICDVCIGRSEVKLIHSCGRIKLSMVVTANDRRIRPVLTGNLTTFLENALFRQILLQFSEGCSFSPVYATMVARLSCCTPNDSNGTRIGAPLAYILKIRCNLKIFLTAYFDRRESSGLFTTKGGRVRLYMLDQQRQSLERNATHVETNDRICLPRVRRFYPLEQPERREVREGDIQVGNGRVLLWIPQKRLKER